MNRRLELCKEQHDHGHDRFDQTYIPDRLIDVRSETLRLIFRNEILPSNCSSEFKYAALSYCWGSGESQAKTTTTTLYDRQAGISEAEMPPVLCDAIRVTRALGISFLWVDALCILQDDQSDWERQCAEMNNIYGAAHVTLCVANSRSCDEGFLRQTLPCIRLPFQSLQEPEVAGSFLVQCNDHLSGGSFPYSHPEESGQLLCDDVLSSRWDERGWIFQENQLSTRKLIFGSRNLYFECNYMSQARGKHVTSDRYRLKIKPPSVSITFTEKNPKVIYEAWDSSILYEYSTYDASSFSCAADVLPALSGLARLFGDRLKDAYYAGHWERDLYRSLSWNGPRLSSLAKRPAELIIPSWSLLAKGDIDPYTKDLSFQLDLRSEIKILKARVVTVGDNPFGALKECRLWIRGYTLDMNRGELQVMGPLENRRWGGWHLVVHQYCFGHLSFDWQAGLDDPRSTCPSAEDIRGLKLLLLGSFKGHEFTRQGYGLIISPTGNNHEFRRVGVILAGQYSHMCTPHGDLEALQSLAQLETVQLV